MPMTKKVEELYFQIQRLLSKACTNFNTKDYQDFLEEVSCDVEGRLDGLKEDQEEE